MKMAGSKNRHTKQLCVFCAKIEIEISASVTAASAVDDGMKPLITMIIWRSLGGAAVHKGTHNNRK